MTEIRCVKCNRLLMKVKGEGILIEGTEIEVKCSKCGYVNRTVSSYGFTSNFLKGKRFGLQSS